MEMYALSGRPSYYSGITTVTTVNWWRHLAEITRIEIFRTLRLSGTLETTLASGLNELGAYYNENHLRPNLAKTQQTALHLKNHQADRTLNVTWNGTSLTIHTHPFTLASHSTAHSPTETTATRRAQNSPPETTSSGSCMVRTGARAPTPWGRRRQHYVSPWRSTALLSGPIPPIASSSKQR